MACLKALLQNNPQNKLFKPNQIFKQVKLSIKKMPISGNRLGWGYIGEIQASAKS